MLFILTGDIQTGKTRWLQALVGTLAAGGVPVAGVLAPGVWRACDTPSAEALGIGCKPGDRFEKLGIDNVMLPQGERVRFATRWDLAEGAAGQTTLLRNGRGWVFDDAALARVDDHFAGLLAQVQKAPQQADLETAGALPKSGLLVVDELGRLELAMGKGLVHAMKLLGQGPTSLWPHALAVVRRDLVPLAIERFDGVWDAIEPIPPTDAAAARIASLYVNG